MIDHDTLNGIDYEADYDIDFGGEVVINEIRPDSFTRQEQKIIKQRIIKKSGQASLQDHENRIKRKFYENMG